MGVRHSAMPVERKRRNWFALLRCNASDDGVIADATVRTPQPLPTRA
jgi:hypothetical protein